VSPDQCHATVKGAYGSNYCGRHVPEGEICQVHEMPGGPEGPRIHKALRPFFPDSPPLDLRQPRWHWLVWLIGIREARRLAQMPPARRKELIQGLRDEVRAATDTQSRQ